jgi:small GTP-binding protein
MVDQVPSPKVIFIGDTDVGKTSLIHRAKYDQFNDSSNPSVAVGVTEMDARHNGAPISYLLVDTAGQERYRSIVPLYFRDVCGAVLVFSLLERSSFTNLPMWIDDLAKHATGEVPIIVVGNKSDKPRQKWEVTEQDALGWAKQRGITLIFTSALSGAQVTLLLDHIVRTFVVPRLGAFPSDEAPGSGTSVCCT